uniref:28S ribosomal protein S35, mitochondrial-like n=1 Tax=Crassostrea virginica TaxID=6565 RepID=A0A8B8A7D3_CRAVI|nr:28S ribosomal protein S35, mitochondrial-like [Crassostrea virginica]
MASKRFAVELVCEQLLLLNVRRSAFRYAQRCCIHSRIKEELEDERYKVLDIYRDIDLVDKYEPPEQIEKHMTRAECMKTDQTWSDVWPVKAPYHWGSVPLPLRQGYRKKDYLLSRGKYGNTELIKIPNFLHLTPPHIKKHCQAIKKFCSEFPSELKNPEIRNANFPLEVITSDYVTCGQSIRDERSREVTVNVNLSVLKMDEHSVIKMKKLAGDRMDEKAMTLQLKSDRCPVRKQNLDFNIYTLTALYFESQEKEAWEEDEMEESDWVTYQWDKTKSKQKILQLKQKINQVSGLEVEVQEGGSEVVAEDSDVQSYKSAFSNIKDGGDTRENMEAYKQSVLKLLKL